MSEGEARSFSRAYKLEAIRRMEAGENVSALARELTVKRVLLYRWRDQYRRGGEPALRERRGRPSLAEARERAVVRGPAVVAADLAQAQRRIAELERKIGQQQLDLDFFRGALRHIEASRQASETPGATASLSRSGR